MTIAELFPESREAGRPHNPPPSPQATAELPAPPMRKS